MPVFGGDSGGAGNPFKGDAPNPAGKLQKILSALESGDVEVHIVDRNGTGRISPADLERAFQEYAQNSQDKAIYSKWLQIDTKANKATREYQTDLRSLIASITLQAQAQETLQSQIPEPMSNPDVPKPPKPTLENRRR